MALTTTFVVYSELPALNLTLLLKKIGSSNGHRRLRGAPQSLDSAAALYMGKTKDHADMLSANGHGLPDLV